MSSGTPRTAEPSARVLETHSAVLFFVGDRVYKMKKPVDLGFLDHTTVEARRRACQQEVALNARLAPDAYLGVAEVRGPDGAPCEHLVVMRRMPEDRRLARCVERGEDVDDALRHIAHSLAVLHDSRPPDAVHDQLGSVAAVRARWVAGFEQLAELTDLGLDAEREARIEHLVGRYLEGRGDLFAHRVRRGRVRDGHGDLQAEDIFLLPEGPQVLDCIEFSEDYRWGDVLADAAFLAMDLERLGRPELGARFLALHRELSADRWPASLGHHYVAYRAHVRAKVGALRAFQAGKRVDDATDGLFSLALRHLELGRVRLVVVGGPPGTGKSTVAGLLGDRLDAVVLRSDEVRARTTAAEGADPYGAAEVAATYERMFADARRLLAMGEHVILDATFGDPTQRAAAREVAAATASDLVELRCDLPVDVAVVRVASRQAAGGDPSEATPEVARRLAARFAPWPEAHRVDTSGAVIDAVVAAEARVS